VAQNRRRCNTGKSVKNKEIHRKWNPRLAVFQTVAVKRIKLSDPDDSSNVIRDIDSHRTKKPTRTEAQRDSSADLQTGRNIVGLQLQLRMGTVPKKQAYVFHELKPDNKQIHTSTILFRCPVPESLINSVRTGASIVDDFATLFWTWFPSGRPPGLVVRTTFFRSIQRIRVRHPVRCSNGMGNRSRPAQNRRFRSVAEHSHLRAIPANIWQQQARRYNYRYRCR